jgi:hypothetical protein
MSNSRFINMISLIVFICLSAIVGAFIQGVYSQSYMTLAMLIFTYINQNFNISGTPQPCCSVAVSPKATANFTLCH